MSSDRFYQNNERQLWAAHQRAARLLDDEPGLTSRAILDAVNQRWRDAFMRVPK